MVEASNRLGLYIAIPAYFAMLCAVPVRILGVQANGEAEQRWNDGPPDEPLPRG
jgi:hypothetical protein